MHPNNIHNSPYDFEALHTTHPALAPYIFVNTYGTKTIDFADNRAVLELNKAILKHYYHITDWNIPKHYLCPPIPGRADYIHHIADLLDKNTNLSKIQGLDIGVGANCIYPILGAQIYGWNMVGADIHTIAVTSALANVNATPDLKDKIEIRHQKDNAHIFEGIILSGEYYHFTMCNPPFHASKEIASKGTLQKLKNLQVSKSLELNFGGQANELWCNGGETLFIKRMIKQSVAFKTQVGWFTSLVSKKENLIKLYKQLNKLKVEHRTIEMSHGNKQSRFIAWRFE
ncbi:23S rRNA (adenine(1618)-N(6))-methyltransferase RlmF [Aquimarina muelleri]|uniref:Ribosomal RNA large subunit methyltransferase F n=1 Tax=Aquimarina muelleri TaxID=279356 RepID=A0A918JSG7_9FLAO|nr:23S rRNA (adenine(1618)-N(6))-methyltransferase RlmF [Aquimarina muelleri]MCX2762037.1 23S rRNA (adenine(1618)-N(6))-methyltransferase RlmF [Aquimarina muelleri]GGX03990.1 ribosomal RNA large subunit methyltransferase F [Aquimarina muelleri]